MEEKNEDESRPSQGQEGEEESEFISVQLLTMSELQDMQEDLNCQPAEHIFIWLIQWILKDHCWDQCYLTFCR